MNTSIRPYALSDRDALHEAMLESVAELRPFMPWCDPEVEVSTLGEWIEAQVAAFEARAAFEFVIVSGDGRYLGGCGINQIDPVNARANVGYWVRTSAAGRGVGTRALSLLIEWGMANTDLVRFEVVASTRNPASIRMAEKAGAVREGTLRKRLLLYGEWHDAAVLSFVRG